MSQGIRHAPLFTFFTPAHTSKKIEGAQPILQLYRLHGHQRPRDSSLFLQSCLCQYVKDLMRNKAQSGEYRGRTDDLLHAMQAL